MTPPRSVPIPEVDLPNPIGLGLRQARLEITALLRSKDELFFTLGLPLMFLLVFGVIFSDTLEGTDVGVGQWFTPGIIAASVLSAGFVNLATSLAIERHDGTLRRLALTPLPTSAYLIGKILMTILVAAGMTVVLLVTGVLLFDVSIPTGADRWLTFAWVFLLGVVAASVLGIAMSAIPRDAKSASAVFNLPFLGLMFISGVFIEFSSIPAWLRTVSGIFPLRWLAAGMRAGVPTRPVRTCHRTRRLLPTRLGRRGPLDLGRRGIPPRGSHIPVGTRTMRTAS